MGIRRSRFTIVRANKPHSTNTNDDLQWFCDSLGLLGTRDRDKSCFRMFIVLIKALKNRQELTSDEIADQVGLSRGTVIHHIHKLINSGIVVSRSGAYMLRVNNLSGIVEEIEHDMQRTLDDIKEVAEELDGKLDL